MTYDPFSPQAAQQFLSGGGVAAKWPRIGYVVEGTVTGFEMLQCTDYDTGEPLFWEGKAMVTRDRVTGVIKPVMQMKLDIQGEPTGETWEGLGNVRKALPDDTGARTAYVKGALQGALIKALTAAGAKLEEGAYVRIERVADGVQPDRKKQAPHQYKATWTPAAKNARAAQEFMDGAEEANPFAPKEAPF
jgi:hypothetical protein